MINAHTTSDTALLDTELLSEPELLSDTELLSEPELLSAARSGDMTAFAELWRRYRRFAFATARSLTSSFDPDDVAAEAFTRILAALRNQSGPTTSFGGYLRQTLRAVVNNWGAKRQAATETDLVDAELLATPARFADHDDVLSLRDAFALLPQQWRTVLWLSDVEGRSSAETAAALGITPEAARSLAYRARRRLRDLVSAPESKLAYATAA
jgi:RNA polymerase sigma factor (sigma-70 family)